MNRLHLQIAPMQRPAEMHKAAIVESRAVFGFCCQQVSKLGVEHGGGDVRILHGECTAKAAAAVEIRHRRKFQSPDLLQKPERALAYMQSAQPMATRMVRNAVGEACADIFKLELVRQEFAELKHPRQQSRKLISQLLVSEFGKQPGVLIPDHCHAGRRRNHDAVCVSVELNKAL